MTPEEKARQQIDAQLAASGWVVQDKSAVHFAAARGVAVSEVSLKTGELDYLLSVDAKAIGILEAKPAACFSSWAAPTWAGRRFFSGRL